MVVCELKVGNAKVKVCDDCYRDIPQAQMEARKRHLREVMGKIARTPGAPERLAAFKEQESRKEKGDIQVIWHIPVSDAKLE